jgi:hypothetical protein
MMLGRKPLEGGLRDAVSEREREREREREGGRRKYGRGDEKQIFREEKERWQWG